MIKLISAIMSLTELLRTSKGYIFDMDGTIVDLEELNYKAMENALGLVGINLTHDMYVSHMAGVAIRKGMESIVNKHKIALPLSELILEFWRYKRNLLRSNLKAVVSLKPGVTEFIKTATKSGKKLAVATSARREFLEFVLTAFDLLKYFPVTITADDIQKSKPDPEIFLKAQKALNLPKSDCIVFEDSKNGILGAKAAGITCIGIKTDRWNKDIVKLADYVINDYKTILTIFPGK